MQKTTYGLHLTLQLTQFDRPTALDDREAVSRFLVDLVRNIDMRILAGPLIGRENGPPEKSGWSGLVILFESHAAIHTYPDRAAAFLDIFSCRDFAIEQVGRTLTEHFGLHQVAEQVLAERGAHWSVDIEREMLSWRSQR